MGDEKREEGCCSLSLSLALSLALSLSNNPSSQPLLSTFVRHNPSLEHPPPRIPSICIHQACHHVYSFLQQHLHDHSLSTKSTMCGSSGSLSKVLPVLQLSKGTECLVECVAEQWPICYHSQHQERRVSYKIFGSHKWLPFEAWCCRNHKTI